MPRGGGRTRFADPQMQNDVGDAEGRGQGEQDGEPGEPSARFGGSGKRIENPSHRGCRDQARGGEDALARPPKPTGSPFRNELRHP